MTSGPAPYSLVNRTWMRVPPALSRTTCRMVWSAKPGLAGKGPMAGAGGSGAAPQDRTHGCGAAETAVAAINSRQLETSVQTDLIGCHLPGADPARRPLNERRGPAAIYTLVEG